ncbi:MAG: alpha/beta fold hydrolase [Thermoleophilia bacterium]|nr:alpha/beta fold hydrolase [Thermoleophilia bacterium]
MTAERITIGGDGPPLAADLYLPDTGVPLGGVVICHPHPAYRGTRASHVVRALIRAVVADSMAALAFDFRGAGESAGESVADHTEWGDAARALDVLEDALPPGTPLAIAGYSFGAWVALNVGAADPRVRAVAAVAPGSTLPTDMGGSVVAVAHPENDHITPVPVIADWMESVGGGELTVIHGADHFLIHHAPEVSMLLAAFLARALSSPPPLESTV